MNRKVILAAVILFCAFAQIACAQDGRPRPDSSQQIADRITASKIPVVIDFWAA
jgi:hypothetical protein